MNLNRIILVFAVSLITASTALAQSSMQDINIPALVRETNRNGVQMSSRMFDYTFTQTVSLRLINKNGRVKTEPLRVYEVYPMPGRRLIKKLVSEDGMMISQERAAKELKRVSDALTKAEREEEQKKAKQTSQASVVTLQSETQCEIAGYATEFFGADGGEIIFSIPDFLCAGEFYAPRRESFRGRDTIVLSFRPRASYVPPSKARAPIAKLIGTVWIDASDKIVSRLEAWTAAQQSVAQSSPRQSFHTEAALIYEQVRLADGTWLHASTRMNTASNPSLFNGVNIDFKDTFDDFHRFNAESKSFQLASPKP